MALEQTPITITSAGAATLPMVDVTPRTFGLVLSLFPGAGLLDAGFTQAGFSVVRGPDLLLG